MNKVLGQLYEHIKDRWLTVWVTKAAAGRFDVSSAQEHVLQHAWFRLVPKDTEFRTKSNARMKQLSATWMLPTDDFIATSIMGCADQEHTNVIRDSSEGLCVEFGSLRILSRLPGTCQLPH